MCLSSVFDNNITMPLYETYVRWPTNLCSSGVGTYVICLMNPMFIFDARSRGQDSGSKCQVSGFKCQDPSSRIQGSGAAGFGMQDPSSKFQVSSVRIQDSSVRIDLRSSLLTLDRVQTSLTLFSLSRRLQVSGSKFQVSRLCLTCLLLFQLFLPLLQIHPRCR